MGYELVDVTGNAENDILKAGDLVGLMLTPTSGDDRDFEEVALPERVWAEVVETGKVSTCKLTNDPSSRKLGVRRGSKVRFQTKHVWAAIRRSQ